MVQGFYEAAIKIDFLNINLIKRIKKQERKILIPISSGDTRCRSAVRLIPNTNEAECYGATCFTQ